METDREVLMWLHNRLVIRGGESECVDFVRRLRCIIKATSPTKTSRKTNTCNNSLK